ncbi:MAG: hypothetical protein ACFCVH_17810 [Alphaproteobacteria bacterium]
MRSDWLLATAFLALTSGPVAALEDPPTTDCDRLAAEPGMVAGVPGFALDAIEAGPAMTACEQAVRDHPGVLRFVHQYARALQRGGNADAAARLYEWAAGDGLAAAQYALGRMLQAGDGVPADPAAAARWLEAAAAQGHAEAAGALAIPAPLPSAALPASGATDTEAHALADSLEGIAEVLDSLRRDAPRDRFDPLAVLQPAGVSIEALTAWVEREIALVPYRGSLRGARGTLMDRYANSLDRALLLAELLTHVGYDARLARATLEPAVAEALLDGFAPPPGDEQPVMDRGVLAASLAAAAGVYADDIQAEIEESTRAQSAREAAVRDRSAALTQDLLRAAGDLPRQEGDTRAGAIAALQDHWWVQVRDGETWIDVDPSRAVVGALTTGETLLPADLPGSLRHNVNLRVIVEFWEDGQLREETLLSQGLAPADVIDRPLVIRHLPLSAPPPRDVLEAATGDPVAAALDAAADAWVWQPVLRIGDEAVIDQLFTMRGEVLLVGPEALQSLGIDSGLFGDFAIQIGSVFDDGPAPEPATAPDEATAPVRVTAEWLEITIEVPGEPAVTHRRTVFDLLSPSARSAEPVPAPTIGPAERLQRALGLIREVDILVTGAAPAESYLRQVLARDGADLMRTVAPLLRSEAHWADTVLGDMPRVPLPLYRYAMLRFGDGSAGRSAQPYLDRPNVALAWSGAAGTEAADLRATLLFDIVANEVAIPVGSDAFAARLAQGVRETVVEDEIAGPGATGNTAALYEADRLAGRAWVPLDPADPAALDRLGLPDDARAAIARDLASGALVIAPPSPVATADGPQVAWWRVDQRTGTTLGMNPAGGAALTEEAYITIMQGIQVGGCFVILGQAIAGGLGGLAAGAAICMAGGITGGVAGGVGSGVFSSGTALIGGVIAFLTT